MVSGAEMSAEISDAQMWSCLGSGRGHDGSLDECLIYAGSMRGLQTLEVKLHVAGRGSHAARRRMRMIPVEMMGLVGVGGLVASQHIAQASQHGA